MASFWKTNVLKEPEYEGSSRDANELLKYLRRTNRLNYQLEDLENVCTFLGRSPRTSSWCVTWSDRGLKAYPHSASFHLVLAGVAMHNPMFFLRPERILDHLHEALRLAEASSRPEERRLLPAIKQMLSVLHEISSRIPAFPFGSPFGGASPSGKTGSMQGS